MKCRWCGKELGSADVARCPHCGGKLGLHRRAVEVGPTSDDPRDPLLHNEGAAAAFRELWLGPLVLGVGALALGLSALVSGPPPSRGEHLHAGIFDELRTVGPHLVAVGLWFSLLGVGYRLTRIHALAYAMALGWLVAVLGLPGWVLIQEGIGRLLEAIARRPRGILGLGVWIVVAFLPLVRVWKLHQLLIRVRPPD